MEALHLRAQSLCCVAQRLVDCSLKIHKSAFNLLSVSSKPRPNGISRNMSFNLVARKRPVQSHAYDAGILSSTERQDPGGGPVPSHWTFEGLYGTIRMASPPLSPGRARPSQPRPDYSCMSPNAKGDYLLSNLSRVSLTYVYRNAALLHIALHTYTKNKQCSS